MRMQLMLYKVEIYGFGFLLFACERKDFDRDGFFVGCVIMGLNHELLK